MCSQLVDVDVSRDSVGLHSTSSKELVQVPPHTTAKPTANDTTVAVAVGCQHPQLRDHNEPEAQRERLNLNELADVQLQAMKRIIAAGLLHCCTSGPTTYMVVPLDIAPTMYLGVHPGSWNYQFLCLTRDCFMHGGTDMPALHAAMRQTVLQRLERNPKPVELTMLDLITLRDQQEKARHQHIVAIDKAEQEQSRSTKRQCIG